MYIVNCQMLVAIVTSMLRCHDNCNVGLHVCAKFHDLTNH